MLPINSRLVAIQNCPRKNTNALGPIGLTYIRPSHVGKVYQWGFFFFLFYSDVKGQLFSILFDLIVINYSLLSCMRIFSFTKLQCELIRFW